MVHDSTFEEAFLYYWSWVLKKPPRKPAPLQSPHKTKFLPLPTTRGFVCCWSRKKDEEEEEKRKM